jgi:hypothetical protein
MKEVYVIAAARSLGWEYFDDFDDFKPAWTAAPTEAQQFSSFGAAVKALHEQDHYNDDAYYRLGEGIYKIETLFVLEDK